MLFVNTRSVMGADVEVHLTLIQHLGAQNVDVHVVTNRLAIDVEQTLARLRRVPNLRPLTLNLGRELASSGGNRFGRLFGALRNLSALPALFRIAWHVWSRKIDFVHVTDRPRDACFAIILARLGLCRSILHVHNKWNAHIGRAAVMAVPHCTRIIAISEFTRRSMLDGGLPASKIAVCHNATDAAIFDPAQFHPGLLRTKLGIASCVPLIGIVARIMLWKGHQELIEAMAKIKAALPAAHLAIIGKTADIPPFGGTQFEEALTRRIETLELTDCVHWAGWHDDMPGVMADLDVLAVPSWEEPFGLVVTEGMAMQLPIVGYNSGALPEIVTHGVEGLLVPPKDADALAAALISLLEDPHRREAMGRKGRERVLRAFTPERQARRMAEIYRAALGGTQCGDSF